MNLRCPPPVPYERINFSSFDIMAAQQLDGTVPRARRCLAAGKSGCRSKGWGRREFGERFRCRNCRVRSGTSAAARGVSMRLRHLLLAVLVDQVDDGA